MLKDLRSINYDQKSVPVKKSAKKPDFCTELSELNSSVNVLLSEVIGIGSVEPQYIPFTTDCAPVPLVIRTLSYSQFCCKYILFWVGRILMFKPQPFIRNLQQTTSSALPSWTQWES